MRQGFVKVAAVTPKIVVADTKENTALICAEIKKAEQEGAKIIVLPELCITGYTCSDLFLQEKMLREARQSLLEIAAFTFALDCIVFVGLPLEYNGKLYNVAAAVSNGKVLGFVPKTYLPNYNEFYEARHFTRGMEETVQVSLGEEVVPMGKKLLFTCQTMPELKIGVELCEDLWTPEPPSIRHALNGANVIVNLSASDETTGKDIYREELVGGQSARLLCGYIYASAGDGESTQDVVYSAHNIIAENGRILKKAKRFANETVYSEIDVLRLNAERRRMTTFETRMDGYTEIPFALKIEETELTRYIDPMPFVHMVAGLYALVAVPQIDRLVRVALQTAEIELADMDETEPFVPHAEHEQFPVVLRGRFVERHLVACAREREAVCPEFFYVHFGSTESACRSAFLMRGPFMPFVANEFLRSGKRFRELAEAYRPAGKRGSGYFTVLRQNVAVARRLAPPSARKQELSAPTFDRTIWYSNDP